MPHSTLKPGESSPRPKAQRTKAYQRGLDDATEAHGHYNPYWYASPDYVHYAAGYAAGLRQREQQQRHLAKILREDES